MNAIPHRPEHLEAEAAFAVLARSQALMAKGRDIINLGIGQPDYRPPAHVIKAAQQALDQDNHGYTASPGLESTRQAVATYIANHYDVEVPFHNVLITPGGKVTMSFASLLLGEPGKNIVVPDPGFPTYGIMAKFSGAQLRTYGLVPQLGHSFRAQEVLNQIDANTRLLILNSPGNPTGGLADPAELQALIAGLRAFPNCYILSDEIYSRLCFDQPFQSLLTFPELKSRLIVLDGWSKTYAMTGWRLGWSVWPETLMEAATNLAIHMHSCVNASAQRAGEAALLGDQSSVEEMKGQYARRRDFLVTRLNKIEGLSCARPGGAFYAFPDVSGLGVTGLQAQEELLEDYGLASLAGTSFGDRATHNVRLSFATSIQQLDRACARIEAWAKAKGKGRARL